MNTNKAIFLFLALCVCSTVFMVDAKAGASPGTNLGVIPDYWSLHFGSGPQIIFLDYSVVRTAGKPSIRLEPHTASDVNNARECDCWLYTVKPGDHIVAKCWMKIDDNGDRQTYSGARIGIDLYNRQNGHNYILYGIQCPTYPNTPEGEKNNYVGWGTVGWVQRTIDFIVPSSFFTHEYSSGQTIPQTQVNGICLWMQVWSGTYGGTEQGNAWFADAELYINPNFTSTAPTPLPQNVQIAVSSYSLTNQNDATLLMTIQPSSTGLRSAAGQCFTGMAGYKLASAQFALAKVGSPSGNLVAALYAMTGSYGANGAPTGSPLAVSNVVAISTISRMAMCNFTFPQPSYMLRAGTYCIALQVYSGTGFSGSNYIMIGYDNTASTHAGNYFIYCNNGWQAYSWIDACFSVSLTP